MTDSAQRGRAMYPPLERIYMDAALAEEIRALHARLDRRKRLLDQRRMREDAVRRGGHA